MSNPFYRPSKLFFIDKSISMQPRQIFFFNYGKYFKNIEVKLGKYRKE